MNLEKQFLPYELALKFKELGFKESCFATYSGETLDTLLQIQSDDYFTAAPLWQQSYDWFENKYNLYITIHGESLNGHRIGFYYSIVEDGWINYYESLDDDLIFDTKEEARQACLEKLIELCNKK